MNAPQTLPTCIYSAETCHKIIASAARHIARIDAKPAGDQWDMMARKSAKTYQRAIITAATGVLDHLAGHDVFEDAEWELAALLEADNARPAETYLMAVLS